MYRVVDYDSKWYTKFHNDCILEISKFHFQDDFVYKFFKFQASILAHVGPTAFATLQIELYHVVDYDSKWYTKCHKDCMCWKLC